MKYKQVINQCIINDIQWTGYLNFSGANGHTCHCPQTHQHDHNLPKTACSEARTCSPVTVELAEAETEASRISAMSESLESDHRLGWSIEAELDY